VVAHYKFYIFSHMNTLLLVSGFLYQGTAYIYWKLFMTLREQNL
jgi:hypothetical protein